MAKRFLFGFAGLVLTLGLTLAMVEVALRVYSRVTPNVDVEFFRYASLMKGSTGDSALRFRHTPDSRHTLFGVDVDINSRGFRDAELGTKEPGTTRIALLGDSVTFGWGVPYGERFSEILERDWSAAGSPLELINTGHGNWNTAQEYAALSELLAGEKLDGILQVWYINDAEPTPVHRRPPWHSRFYLSIFIWAKSDLVQRRLGSRESYADYYRGLYREDAEGYGAFVQALNDTGAWARDRGLPWVFVVLPEFHQFPGPFAGVYQQVAAAASRAGAIVVDATGEFAAENPETVWVARNDVHPNARGHAVIARAIRQAVDPAIFRGGA